MIYLQFEGNPLLKNCQGRRCPYWIPPLVLFWGPPKMMDLPSHPFLITLVIRTIRLSHPNMDTDSSKNLLVL